jgi:hypothetical protein
MGLRGKGIIPLAKQRILIKVQAAYDPADDMELRHALLHSLPRSVCFPTSPSTALSLARNQISLSAPALCPLCFKCLLVVGGKRQYHSKPSLAAESCDLVQRLQLTLFQRYRF